MMDNVFRTGRPGREGSEHRKIILVGHSIQLGDIRCLRVHRDGSWNLQERFPDVPTLDTKFLEASLNERFGSRLRRSLTGILEQFDIKWDVGGTMRIIP